MRRLNLNFSSLIYLPCFKLFQDDYLTAKFLLFSLYTYPTTENAHHMVNYVLFISAGAAAAPSPWCTPGREGGWWRRRSENISQNPRTAAPARAALRGYQQLINWGFQQTYIQPESIQSKEYAPGIWYMGEDINGIAIFDTQYSYCYIIAKKSSLFSPRILQTTLNSLVLVLVCDAGCPVPLVGCLGRPDQCGDERVCVRYVTGRSEILV